MLLIDRFEQIKAPSMGASAIIIAALMAIMSAGFVMNQQIAYAQMIGEHGDNTSGLHEDQQEMTINGTINLEQTIIEAIDSKVNTSLIQAITSAEQSVGINSFALAAFGANIGGSLLYTIILGTPGTDFYYTIVDPGNGQVLSSQKSSQKEIEDMHLKHSEAVVEDEGIDAGSFGLRALRH